MSVATHYRRIRRDRPTEPASRAIFWARNMDKIDRLASRTEWEWTGDYTGAFLIGRVDGIEIRVYNDAERNALETAHETGLIATARDELERRRTRAEVRGEN